MHPDVVVRKAFLSLDEQRSLVQTIMAIDPGFYVPRTRFNVPLRLRMLCLGEHWSARDYGYHATRVDVDNLPCPPVPDALQTVARRALIEANYLAEQEIVPYELCIVNWYDEATGRLGDHVDNSESPESIASGYPIVSISLGASCIFRMGGLGKRDPYAKHVLESGDLVVFGRSMRLAHHGVSKLLPGTTPADLGITNSRINLTFRRR
jgi:alkylated DNA repair protein (DNA oxidative demethylase)